MRDRWMEVSELNPGDIVELTNGNEYEFVRLKKTKFIGKTLDGKASYDIPVAMFERIVKKVDIQAMKKETSNTLKSLKKGDLFYIDVKGNATLFTFETIDKGRIIGINPITGGKTRIDQSLFIDKVENLNK